MGDVIVSIIILATIGLAGTYIIRAKKRGIKCVGCPYAGTIDSNNKSCSCNRLINIEVDKKY